MRIWGSRALDGSTSYYKLKYTAEYKLKANLSWAIKLLNITLPWKLASPLKSNHLLHSEIEGKFDRWDICDLRETLGLKLDDPPVWLLGLYTVIFSSSFSASVREACSYYSPVILEYSVFISYSELYDFSMAEESLSDLRSDVSSENSRLSNGSPC